MFLNILDICYRFLDDFVEKKVSESNLLAGVFANIAILLLAIMVTIADWIAHLLDLLALTFWILFYPLAIDYYVSQNEKGGRYKWQ